MHTCTHKSPAKKPKQTYIIYMYYLPNNQALQQGSSYANWDILTLKKEGPTFTV